MSENFVSLRKLIQNRKQNLMNIKERKTTEQGL